MKDFYAILGVSPSVDEKDLKSAYRKLAKEYHPDTNKTAEAESRFKEIGEAYDVLKDKTKRAEYDATRAGHQANQFRWHTNPNRGQQNASDLDLEEILRDISRSRRASAYDARNRDIVLSYSITLEEAFTGKEADLSYNLPGKETQKIQFKIPAGIQDGIKLRFLGKGDDQMTHVKAGDLYIKINVIPHHTFVRMGNNLVTSITVDYLDAMLGTDKEIPTIEGKKIKMRVPAGILPGQSLRATGKGMPEGLEKRGDMMVEVVFTSPTLTPEQRELLEKVREQKAS